MTIARYYRRPTDTVFIPFTTDRRWWKEVVVRGMDSTGRDIGLIDTFDVEAGAGGLMGQAGFTYEFVFSDTRITFELLDRVRDPGEAPAPGVGITFTDDNPTPPPPPYPDAPFHTGNIKRLA